MFDHVSIASLVGIAGVLELVGGALLLVGLFVRPVAFVLSGEMAVGYFMAHGSKGNVLVPMLNQGELAVLYCCVFLFLAAAGAGTWSPGGAVAPENSPDDVRQPILRSKHVPVQHSRAGRRRAARLFRSAGC